MIHFDITRAPGYVPRWAIDLDAFLGRIQYKAWRGTEFVVEPRFNEDVPATGAPEVDWYGSKVAVLYRFVDSKIWNEAAAVFAVPISLTDTTSTVVSEIVVPTSKVRFGRVIPPWLLSGSGTDRRRFEWLRQEIHWIECHEADEFLLLDGEPVAHPHRTKAD